MKKILSIVMVVALMLTGMHSAFAQEDDQPTSENQEKQKYHHPMKEGMMKQYEAEFKQLKQLKKDMWPLKKKAAQKQDELLEQVLKMQTGSKKTDLKKVQSLHGEWKDAKKETKKLRKEQMNHMATFHKELKKDNTEGARKHVKEAIGVAQSLVQQYEKEVNLLDRMLESLK